MSNATRSVRRRQWREDHPPTRGKSTRRSFGVYVIEKLKPGIFAAMVKRALSKAGAKDDPDGEPIVSDPGRVLVELERTKANAGSP